jgi:hypothetical protein
MRTRITPEELLSLRPCWSEARVRERVPPRGLTYHQIATARDVAISARQWVLTRLAARTDTGHRQLVLWAAGLAQAVRGHIPEGEARDAADLAVQTAVAWAEGQVTKDECPASAAYAAYYAANAAAYAAYAAYAYAADAAAYAADAASATADAAGYTADAAERQLRDLARALAAAGL